MINKSVILFLGALIFGVSVLVNPSGYVFAEDQSWDQHKELFIKGTITDSDGRVWNVRFIPGVCNVTNNAVQSWKDSGSNIADWWSANFYKEYVVEEFLDGVTFSKDVVIDHWAKGIADDFKDAGERSSEDGFGKVFGVILNWAWFGTKAIGRTIWLPIGSTGGVAYAIVVPVGAWTSRPVAATYNGVWGGMTAPVVLYVWNGSAWVATYFEDVPKNESFWVKLQGAGSGETLMIDQKGFNAILQGSVLEHLTNLQVELLQERINELEKQIVPLQAEQHKKHMEQNGLREEMRNKPDYQAMEAILNQVWFEMKTAKLSEDAQAVYLDNAKLRSLVVAYLSKLNITDFSEQQVQEVIDTLKRNIENLLGSSASIEDKK